MADIEKNDDNEPSWLREPKEDSALNSKNSDSAAELSTPIAPSNAESSRVPLPTTAKKMKWKQPSTTIRTVSVPEEDCCCCPTDPVMYYLRIYHFFAGLACFLAIIGDIYYLINNEATWHEIALHTFSVLFSVIMLAVELEIQFIVHRLLLLEQWVFRGLLYWHIGVITTPEEANSLFTSFISAYLTFIGVGYILLGTCCYKAIKSRQQQSSNSVNRELYREIPDDFSPIRA